MDYVKIIVKYLKKAIIEILTLYKPNTDHALYISFEQFDENVVFPHNLSDDSIVTIVLQNEFSDIVLTDLGFGVTIIFENGPAHIFIPFSSIVYIYDQHNEFYMDLSGAIKIKEEDDEEHDDKLIHVKLYSDD